MPDMSSRPTAVSDEARRLAAIGAALSSPNRAAIVCALSGGTAHTTTELARHCGVALSTTSEHLAALLDAGLVVTAPQGRHRYHRLASAEVAAALEQLLATVVAPGSGTASLPRVPAKLRFCRSCYDHMAGRLGVAVHDGLVGRQWVADGALTDRGRRGLIDAGVDLERPDHSRRPELRSCLDWSERRHHLGGFAAERILRRSLEAGWLRRDAAQPRHLALTVSGRAGLATAFGVQFGLDGHLDDR